MIQRRGGLDYKSNPILQFTGTFLSDEKVIDRINIYLKPDPDQIIEPAALAVNGIDPQKANYTQVQGYSYILSKLDRHCNKFNPRDKMFLVGYNNVAFDNKFFQQLFKRNNNPYFYAYFWGSIDLLVLCNSYFSKYREFLPNMKLGTAAKLLGIEVDPEQQHDSAYDAFLTEKIYLKLFKQNKLQLEYSQKMKQKLLED